MVAGAEVGVGRVANTQIKATSVVAAVVEAWRRKMVYQKQRGERRKE